MVHRFTLAAIAAALTLTGCAQVSTTDEHPATQKLANGPAQVSISHIISRTDDGSSIIVTVDGVDAAPLKPGKTTDLYLPEGSHKIGGYVPTLYGLGRVTIAPVAITAVQDKVQHVTYSVLKDKPAFMVGAATLVPASAAPASDVIPATPSITVTTTSTENTISATPNAAPVSTEKTSAATTSSATPTAANITQAVSSTATTVSAHQG